MRQPLLTTSLTIGGTGLAAGWFALHPMPLLIGVTVQPVMVPWWYQVAAFPPFMLLVSGVIIDRTALARRLALLGGASLVALLRLAKFLPVSGHATFLLACVVFCARRPEVPNARWVVVTASAGLVVTSVYKVLWGDEVYFLMSLVLGAVLGHGCAGRALEA